MIETLIAQSDPANVALLGVIWWRLDQRLRELRAMIEDEDGTQYSTVSGD